MRLTIKSFLQAGLFLVVQVSVLAVIVQSVAAQPSPFTDIGSSGKIYFASNRVTAGNPTGDYEIFRMDPDGLGLELMTTNTAMDWHPVASSDSTKIVFASNRVTAGNPQGDHEIYIMDADGSNVSQVTSNTVFDGHPSPKSGGVGISEIVFTRAYQGEFDGELVKITYPGLIETRLTNTIAEEGHANWSGSTITFGSNSDGDWDIYTITDAGAARTKLTSNSILDAGPHWDTTGTKIVFHSKRSGSMAVYTMNSNGTSQTMVPNTNAGNFDGTPYYSFDSTRIVYASEGSGSDWDSEIIKIKPDGTTRVQLTLNTGYDDLWVPYRALVDAPPSCCEIKAENPQNPYFEGPKGEDITSSTLLGFLGIVFGGTILIRGRRRKSSPTV